MRYTLAGTGGTVADLERSFHEAMIGIYHRAKDETGYTPSYFLKMVNDLGGVEAARRLVNSQTPSDGYTKLWELSRLDMSVEALVAFEPEWRSLFSRQDIRAARDRLAAYGYIRECS